MEEILVYCWIHNGGIKSFRNVEELISPQYVIGQFVELFLCVYIIGHCADCPDVN